MQQKFSTGSTHLRNARTAKWAPGVMVGTVPSVLQTVRVKH
jgi:hypothetical protein